MMKISEDSREWTKDPHSLIQSKDKMEIEMNMHELNETLKEMDQFCELKTAVGIRSAMEFISRIHK